MRLAALISAVLILTATFAAEAQDRRPSEGWKVAVLNVVSEGANDQLAVEITQVIKAEARRNTDYHLVEQGDLALLDSLLVFDCDVPTAACMGMLAESLSAERVIYGRLTRAGELYDIRMEIFDAMEGRVVQRWQKRFSPKVDAIGFFSEEMKQFIGGIEPVEPSRLRVSTNVKGAAVMLNGKLVGRTPFMTERFGPGRYRLEVSQEGYVTWIRDITLTKGDDQHFDVTLNPSKAATAVVVPKPKKPGPIVPDTRRGDLPPPLPDDRDGVELSTYGWISLSLGGAALVGAGVASFLLEQTQSDFNDTTLERRAVELRDQGLTQAQTANILYGVGGVAILTGVILIAVSGDEDEAERTQINVAPTEGGAAVSFTAPW